METSLGDIEQVTALKDFSELTSLSVNQYLLGIKNISLGDGSKITLKNLIKSLISTNSDNVLIVGEDNKLYVSTSTTIGDLDNLTTANKTNLVNAINEVNGNVGTLSNLETTEKSNLVNAINEIANVVEPSLQYDVMNNSKAMETGGIYSNSVIYQDVYKYAHSSFDLSKFTVVGSPIITSDGIVSGFLASKYIKINKAINGAFRFKGRFRITNDENSYRAVCSFLANNTAGLFAELRVRQTGIYIAYAQDSSTRASVNASYTFTDDTWYDYEFAYNGTTLDLLINGVSVITPISPYFETITGINIGVTFGAALPFAIGEIDLKYVELKENGIPTFNGNKTGLDVKKSNNYTVVGTPTISADGILSGISTGNYVTVPDSIKNATNYQVDFSFRTVTRSDATSYLFAEGDGNTNGFSLYYGSNNKFYVRVGSSATTNLITTLAEGDLIDLSVIITGGTTGVCKWSKNGVAQTDVTLNMTNYLAFSADNLYVGGRSSGAFFQGSIDLNAIRFYVNGDLVYQPCLKIPYTESKTGSKITDVVYRNRVKDVYEQYGYAPYYTLSDTDFTLPMGEIYGMIEQRANLDLSNISNQAKIMMSSMGMPSETYINLTLGANGNTYIAPSNGWVQVTQGFSGSCSLYVATVYSSQDGICSASQYNTSGTLNVHIPVSKGETFKVGWYGTRIVSEDNRFEFIYAKGSESEAL